MTPTPRMVTAVLAMAVLAGPLASSAAGSGVAGVGPVAGPGVAAAGVRAVAEANRGAGRIIIDWPTAAPPPVGPGDRIVARLPHLAMAVLAVPDVAAALAAYRRVPGVGWAEADRRVVAAAVPSDPLFGEQWTLQSGPGAPRESIDWASAFPGAQGAGALVAVLDTGFEPGGSDQPVNLRTDLAKTFVPGTADTSDDNGHGTFVTDMIAEATDNGVGAAGIAPQADVVPVKVLAANGTGDLSHVAQGIEYAASIGAKVINLSLAGDPTPALCAAVAAAATTAIVVAATGNDATASGTHPLDYPAACPGAMAVGSVAFDGGRPPYANTGCGIAVVAPGGDDLNLYPSGTANSDWIVQQGFDTNPADGALTNTFQYFQEEGTSMSAAEVAGEAALLVGLGADLATVRRVILGTARAPGAGGVSTTFGAGTVDVGAAVAAVETHRWVSAPDRGYQIATAAGAAIRSGDSCTGNTTLSTSAPPALPVVGEAATPDGLGSWLVASDGGIFSFGDARFFGSTGAIRLNQPIVGMAATPTGNGYWLVASDGGIFSFGDAAFFGSTGAIRLNQPITGMASTPTGNGYWMVARDGGMFTFGDAAFVGSTAGTRLAAPIVGMAATSSGRGYWLVGGDGTVFAYGDAGLFGTGGGSGPVVGIIPEIWTGP